MVIGKRGEGYHVVLNDGEHEWHSGFEEKAGGDPDPHRLLEGALAACTIMTVQLYAARKGWPLESTEARVEITEEGPDVNRIRREVRFTGPLSDEQRARLLEIAGRCPVHRFLSRASVIETSLSP